MSEAFSMDITVFIKSASPGNNNYWVLFDAYVSYFNPSKIFKIDFCGTELQSSIPFIDEDKETLRSMLVDDYGYGPFDINKIKRDLGSGKSYVIKKQ